MSALFPDLPLTSFPSDLDSFTTFLNITANDGPLIAQYMAAMEAGNQTLANQVLAKIPSATQKIITATDLNKLSQASLAIERFYKTDIEPYLENQQQEWQNVISQFNYVGNWTSGTQYQENNIVSYTVSGLTMLFIATSTPPVGSNPNNTAYWRVLTIQGQQGVSGVGLSYRQDWSSSASYATNDAVTYNNAVWMALKPSQNVAPQSGSYWKQVISFDVTVYPIQPEQPTDQPVGGLWFNTTPNPTKYVYLAPLGNPATAEEIVTGYQAYDDEGNMITGTAPNLVPLDYPADAGDIFYGKQAYSEEGEVITGTLPALTGIEVSKSSSAPDFYLNTDIIPKSDFIVFAYYTDGSQKDVINYSLTTSNIAATVSYTENGITKTNSVAISVKTPDPILNNNGWDVIRAVSDRGIGSNYWSVGDAKQIILNGTVGTKTYNNYQPWVFILGFNHNASIEGTNRIHFGCFRSGQDGSSNGIALTDQYYNTIPSVSAKTFQMNFSITESAPNVGGWESCDMRSQILGSNVSLPSQAPNETLLNILPNDLKAVLKTCIKYTDNVGFSQPVPEDADAVIDAIDNVTPTEDYLWLLSEYEVFGTIERANPAEKIVQLQYQYYIDGNTKVKYQQASPSEASIWHLRSLYVFSTTWIIISASGQDSFFPDRSTGVAPAFCV